MKGPRLKTLSAWDSTNIKNT